MPKQKPPADSRAVWEIESKIEDAPGSIHPTMKPVETIRRPIAYHTKPGGLIYEPFCGSRHGADRRRGAGADLLRARAEPAVRRRRRGPLGGVHRQAGEAGVSRGQRSSRRRDPQARGRHLRPRGRRRALTPRSFASWRPTAAGRPPSARSRATSPRAASRCIEERKIERREVFAESLARKQRLFARASTGNQLKTALAVQNSIDRMFGDFAGERDELSDVDRFLEAMHRSFDSLRRTAPGRSPSAPSITTSPSPASR